VNLALMSDTDTVPQLSGPCRYEREHLRHWFHTAQPTHRWCCRRASTAHRRACRDRAVPRTPGWRCSHLSGGSAAPSQVFSTLEVFSARGTVLRLVQQAGIIALAVGDASSSWARWKHLWKPAKPRLQNPPGPMLPAIAPVHAFRYPRFGHGSALRSRQTGGCSRTAHAAAAVHLWKAPTTALLFWEG